MSSGASTYQGHELPFFALAVEWKSYVRTNLMPYLRNRVLKVGAGIGAVTRALLHDGIEHWTCLEPDPQLAARIVDTLAGHPARERVETVSGVISDLGSHPLYDTILYFDVLEHIRNDSEELRECAKLVREGGTVIVLAPAYNWLYSSFDEAVGHCRRYSAASLVKVTPTSLKAIKVFYLDSNRGLGSLANKMLLEQRIPSRNQILFWDRRLIPLSCLIDPLIQFRAGRSVVGIWRKR